MATMVTAHLMATVEGGVRARDDRAMARTMSAADKEPTTGRGASTPLDSKPPVLAIGGKLLRVEDDTAEGADTADSGAHRRHELTD